jgi:hypothetical protein
VLIGTLVLTGEHQPGPQLLSKVVGGSQVVDSKPRYILLDHMQGTDKPPFNGLVHPAMITLRCNLDNRYVKATPTIDS